tara:strand:- start:65 stop:310 length:246 start_codon:yes stop_codon:yes gene_type:complete
MLPFGALTVTVTAHVELNEVPLIINVWPPSVNSNQILSKHDDGEQEKANSEPEIRHITKRGINKRIILDLKIIREKNAIKI